MDGAVAAQRDETAAGADRDVGVAPALRDLDRLGIQVAADQHHRGRTGRGGHGVDGLGALGGGPLPQAQRAHRGGRQGILPYGTHLVGAPAAHPDLPVGADGVAHPGAPAEPVGIVRGGLDLHLLDRKARHPGTPQQLLHDLARDAALGGQGDVRPFRAADAVDPGLLPHRGDAVGPGLEHVERLGAPEAGIGLRLGSEEAGVTVSLVRCRARRRPGPRGGPRWCPAAGGRGDREDSPPGAGLLSAVGIGGHRTTLLHSGPSPARRRQILGGHIVHHHLIQWTVH